MTSLKGNNNFIATKQLSWPQQLISPEELIESLSFKTRKLSLIKSPLCSKIVLQIVGTWAYLVANVMNKSRVHNYGTFIQELNMIEDNNDCNNKKEKRIKSPLLTYSNHISCIDDPILWASLLPFTYYSTKNESIRWSPAAKEICFSKSWHSAIFSLGKTFPIIRGAGIDQPAMDFALAILRNNQWLHLFPEGRVMRDDKHQVISNQDRGYIFKWGISKLILDFFLKSSDVLDRERTMRILPFYHLGLDEILPIGWPYVPRIGKKITIFMKESVIDMNQALLRDILGNDRFLCRNTGKYSDDDIKRVTLTRYLESELAKLVEPTAKEHIK